MTNSLLIYEESGYLFNDATKRLEWFEIDKILISFTYGVVRYIGTWGGGRTDKRLEGERSIRPRSVLRRAIVFLREKYQYMILLGHCMDFPQ